MQHGSPEETRVAITSLHSLQVHRTGSVVVGLAPLLWLPQAGLLAFAVQRLSTGGGSAVVVAPAAGILLLGLTRLLVESWGSKRVFATARSHLSILRERVMSSLARRSPFDPDRPASGLAASVIAEQAEAVVPYLVRYRPARWRATFVPLAILPVVAGLSWVAALVLLTAAPLIPLFMALVGWRARAASEAQYGQTGSLNAFLLDRLRGIATLRSLDAVDATATRIGEAAQGLRLRTMAVLRIAFLSSAVLELFSALGVALVAAYVGFHLLGTFSFGTWGHRLSLGEGLFILLLAPAFFEPLRELAAAWHDRAAGEAAFDALTQLVQTGIAMPGSGPAKLDSRVEGAPEVCIRHLDYGHPGQPLLFDDDALRIAPGEHVALTGASGSGKTTMLCLIAGLVPAQRGDIAIGGVSLADGSAQALRRRIGWMGQRPHVFAASVATNIGLGRRQHPDVESAIAAFGLGRVAQAHPACALGEGGLGLSGGEVVRLALARMALDPDADLLLVDEPTAHLDRETAREVVDALLELAQGRTMIVATHDPLLMRRLARVIHLDREPRQEAA